MNQRYRFRNPHPIDMSNYLRGLTCVVGGRDFDREEKDTSESFLSEKSKKEYTLDWSFLKAMQIRPRQNKRF